MTGRCSTSPLLPIEPTDPADSHAEPTLAALIEVHTGKVSDKWSSYIAVYEDLFASRRHQPVRLLEIGVLNGGSLEIWAKYFSAARLILGCDNNPACASLRFDDPRVKLVIADACSNKGARQIAAHADELDIVVDDGSHNSPDIVRSFFRYFPKLANGGIYVVEDLHCSYWQDFEGGLYGPHSSMAFFKALADVLNRQHWGVADSASGFLAAFGTLRSRHGREHFRRDPFHRVPQLALHRRQAPGCGKPARTSRHFGLR